MAHVTTWAQYQTSWILISGQSSVPQKPWLAGKFPNERGSYTGAIKALHGGSCSSIVWLPEDRRVSHLQHLRIATILISLHQFHAQNVKTVAMQRFRALQCPTCRNLTGPKMLVWIVWIETMERDNVYKQQLSPKLTSMRGLFYQHFYWQRHSQTRLDLLKRLSKITTLPINAGFSLFGTEKRQLHLVM